MDIVGVIINGQFILQNSQSKGDDKQEEDEDSLIVDSCLNMLDMV